MTSFHRPCLAFSLPALICSTYVLFSQPVLIPVGAGLISPALTALGLLSDGLGFQAQCKMSIPFLLPLFAFPRFLCRRPFSRCTAAAALVSLPLPEPALCAQPSAANIQLLFMITELWRTRAGAVHPTLR
jgi:hypothetical protein